MNRSNSKYGADETLAPFNYRENKFEFHRWMRYTSTCRNYQAQKDKTFAWSESKFDRSERTKKIVYVLLCIKYRQRLKNATKKFSVLFILSVVVCPVFSSSHNSRILVLNAISSAKSDFTVKEFIVHTYNSLSNRSCS